MKTNRLNRRAFARGFTLIELMVVIGIMALLASLTFMGFQHAQMSASRSKTESFLTGIKSGLEAYNTDFGEYPEPRGDATAKFGPVNYHIGGAMMLYQALSGDGTSEMKLSSGGGKPSNGKVEDDELPNVKFSDMPKDMWKRTSDGYMLMDGFGKPFQYTKFVNPSGGSKTATGQAVKNSDTTMNKTYDLWSYGGDESHADKIDTGSKKDIKMSGKWIKNW